jgi:putative membrane protein
MTVHDLPVVNASLNGLSAVFITIGLISIKSDRKQAHIAAMTAALITSTAFLACYLTYHFSVRVITKFTAQGLPRDIYFPLLISHVILALVTVPLVIVTVVPALRARYDRHRRLARWTWPIWLYVSVTGVIVYLMLYVWFPPAPAA